MPTLKQVHCSIEIGSDHQSLPEYLTRFRDGRVTTYIPIAPAEIRFSVHVWTHDYIAPGLAAFVFIDGQYQCNRNVCGLLEPIRDSMPATYEVDLRLRQKEIEVSASALSQARGNLIGKSWVFGELGASHLHPLTDERQQESNKYARMIDVLILRCKSSSIAGQHSTDRHHLPVQGFQPSNRSVLVDPKAIFPINGNNHSNGNLPNISARRVRRLGESGIDKTLPADKSDGDMMADLFGCDGANDCDNSCQHDTVHERQNTHRNCNAYSDSRHRRQRCCCSLQDPVPNNMLTRPPMTSTSILGAACRGAQFQRPSGVQCKADSKYLRSPTIVETEDCRLESVQGQLDFIQRKVFKVEQEIANERKRSKEPSYLTSTKSELAEQLLGARRQIDAVSLALKEPAPDQCQHCNLTQPASKQFEHTICNKCRSESAGDRDLRTLPHPDTKPEPSIRAMAPVIETNRQPETRAEVTAESNPPCKDHLQSTTDTEVWTKEPTKIGPQWENIMPSDIARTKLGDNEEEVAGQTLLSKAPSTVSSDRASYQTRWPQITSESHRLVEVRRRRPLAVDEYHAQPLPGTKTPNVMSRGYAVQLESGAGYQHRAQCPEYLDSVSTPYAVFRFKCRDPSELMPRLNADQQGHLTEFLSQATDDEFVGVSRRTLVRELNAARKVSRQDDGMKPKGAAMNESHQNHVASTAQEPVVGEAQNVAEKGIEW